MPLVLGEASSVKFLQDQIKQAYDAAKAELMRLSGEAKSREHLAVFLKGFAALGGLGIGVLPPGILTRLLGIGIMVAVIVDQQLTSNHKKLLSRTQGQNAYEVLIREVEHTYNKGLIPLLDELNSSDSVTRDPAISQFKELGTKTLDMLHDTSLAIVKGLQSSNLDALKQLTLETHSPIAQDRLPSADNKAH